MTDQTQIKKQLDLYASKKLGKYKLKKPLGKGGYCEVWMAADTVEGIDVALKIPILSNGKRDSESLLKEVKLVSQLRHPNILHLKNADIVEGHAVMATELSQKTLEECCRPMSPARIITIMTQVLKALEYAHSKKVVHCDVTPSNIFLFPENRAALGDFGIGIHVKGRVVTIDEFGTPGYVAPEQAYGKPSYSSDCFAVAVILYEYLTGVVPKWPFKWPFKGYEKLKQKTGVKFTEFMKKALQLDVEKRFKNGSQMLGAFNDAIPERLRIKANVNVQQFTMPNWRKAKIEQYRTKYSKLFTPFVECKVCSRPVSEQMQFCPWCGTDKNTFREQTDKPLYCPDCKKGVLAEWRFCPWCYGPGFKNPSSKKTKNHVYDSRCQKCSGKTNHFMIYCPWCHAKQKQKAISKLPDKCDKCKWPIDKTFWHFCPWCRENLHE